MTATDSIDGYFFAGIPKKAELIERVLAERSALPAAQPYYRALEAIGARAADEALLALRLVLAGMAAEDERVKRLRDAARSGDRDAYRQELGG